MPSTHLHLNRLLCHYPGLQLWRVKVPESVRLTSDESWSTLTECTEMLGAGLDMVKILCRTYAQKMMILLLFEPCITPGNTPAEPLLGQPTA